MPVPKARLKHVGLVERVAEFLQIDPSVVFLDALPLRERGSDAPELRAKRSRKYRKNTIRIWTLHMDEDEKARIRGLKNEVKAIAEAFKTKIAMSDRHPLGEDGQAAFEDRRRASRWKKYCTRHGCVAHIHSDKCRPRCLRRWEKPDEDTRIDR